MNGRNDARNVPPESAKRLNPATRMFARRGNAAADAVTRVYDEAGKVIETHEHAGDFEEP